jgi:hypothetical protein
LTAPLRQTFTEEAAVDDVLLDDTAGFEFHFPDRGLTLAPDAFVEKAVGIGKPLSQGLWIVGIFRDNVVLAYRSWIG